MSEIPAKFKIHHTEVKWPTCSNDPILKKQFGLGASCRSYRYHMPKTFGSFSWHWSKNICPLKGFFPFFRNKYFSTINTYHYTQTWRVKLLFVPLYLFYKCRVQIASKCSNRVTICFSRRDERRLWIVFNHWWPLHANKFMKDSDIKCKMQHF